MGSLDIALEQTWSSQVPHLGIAWPHPVITLCPRDALRIGAHLCSQRGACERHLNSEHDPPRLPPRPPPPSASQTPAVHPARRLESSLDTIRRSGDMSFPRRWMSSNRRSDAKSYVPAGRNEIERKQSAKRLCSTATRRRIQPHGMSRRNARFVNTTTMLYFDVSRQKLLASAVVASSTPLHSAGPNSKRFADRYALGSQGPQRLVPWDSQLDLVRN